MTRMIELHKVRANAHRDSFSDTDDPTEVSSVPAAPEVDLVTINVDSIRCFYKRRADRGPGTRITFKDGGGFAVAELYEDVKAAVAVQ